ncbi:Splicing factor 3B subunit 4 [Metarhizium anisopliae]
MAQNRHWEQDKEATIYIGNIDERATTATIYEIMLQMGPIHNIHMPRDRVTQNHQGFGFVEFRTPSDAEYAANVMNGIKLFGKSLRVNKASADKQKGADIGAELFIGNLDPMVDEKLLYDTFSRFGPLLSLPKVARDDSGMSKGFGFVSFGDFESSDAAVANLDGQYMLSKESQNYTNPADFHPGAFRPPSGSPNPPGYPVAPPPGFPAAPPGAPGQQAPPGAGPPGFMPPPGFQPPPGFGRR